MISQLFGFLPLSIIYYGLKLIRPDLFLLVTFLVCSISSVFVGSSYSSIATMGVAFIGIGMGLGVNPAMTAGAVVSSGTAGAAVPHPASIAAAIRQDRGITFFFIMIFSFVFVLLTPTL